MSRTLFLNWNFYYLELEFRLDLTAKSLKQNLGRKHKIFNSSKILGSKFMKLSGLFTSKILLRPFMPQSPFLK